jgi:hypothetical protein
MKKRTIAGLVASLATALTLSMSPLPLQAHEATFQSTVTAHRDQKAFYGKVKSSKASCRKNRFVKVVKDHKNGSRTLVGSTTTNRQGEWRIKSPLKRGNYHAQLRKKITTTYKHTHKCTRDTSPEIHVRP